MICPEEIELEMRRDEVLRLYSEVLNPHPMYGAGPAQADADRVTKDWRTLPVVGQKAPQPQTTLPTMHFPGVKGLRRRRITEPFLEKLAAMP
jgi:hypothetical protein